MRILQDEDISASERKTADYIRYRDIMRRCYDPKSKDYPRYGGRGIKVYPPWLRSYKAFKAYIDSLERKPGCNTLDRINNDADYCPGNLQWADRAMQGNNRSSNVVITRNGKTQTLAQWTGELRLRYGTILMRLHAGWTIEAALTTPIRKHTKRVHTHTQQEMKLAA